VTTAKCQFCSPMSYSDTEASVNCILCPYGSYNNFTGATKCDPCPEPSACYCSRNFKIKKIK
jgi:hypothetical protein